MRSIIITRWLLMIPLLFLCLFTGARAQAQGRPSNAKPHQPASQRHTSHPSHPMRNVRPKRHAMGTTRASIIAVRYVVPQQASSTAVSTSSASPTSGSKAATSKSSGSATAASSTKKKSTKKSTRHAKREPTQKAPTPDRISEIQSSLARGGYYQGDPNGKWDANTVTAMQKFQSDHGLDPSGKLDATSLQKLGLGSGIAGVSAPKPATTAPAATPKPSAANTAPAPENSASNASPNSLASNGTSPTTAAPAASDTTHPKPPQR